MSLTEQGFDRPRLAEIKADYDQRFIDALGPLNTSPDAVAGQMIGIFAEALDTAYETLQNTYDAMYPTTAEGVSLDGSVSFVGLDRLGESPTTVIAVCYGVESTAIPAGALARALDNKQYSADAEVVISRSNALHVIIEVISLQNAVNYQIIAKNISLTYLSDANATALEIVTGLAALCDPGIFTAVVIGSTLSLRSADQYSGFPITLDSKLSITTLGSPVAFTALEMGAFALPANSLTKMDTSITGWDSINNLIIGGIGRFVETDAELRVRWETGIRVTGSATAQAIRARLMADVTGVTYVAIYENRTNIIDIYSTPSHAMEAVISGGANQSVANKLFELKPAGIETHGNTAALVLDVNGDSQSCKFSRPVDKFAWARVSVTGFNPEEVLTTFISNAIRSAVLSYGATLNIGEDIITQRFYGPIYEATSGLGSISVEIALTALVTDTPSYTTLNVVVARAEHAKFDLARISVVGV